MRARAPSISILPLLLLLLGAAAASGQQVVVRLRNGAHFQGRLAEQGPDAVEIEMEQGRIQLSRHVVASISPVGMPAEGGKAPAEPGSGPGARPAGPGPRGAASETFLGLLGGALLVAPEPSDAAPAPPLPEGGSVPVVELFLSLIKNGAADEAIDRCVHGELLLQHCFPFHAKGLTSYSKAVSSKALRRLLQAAIAHPRTRAMLAERSYRVRAVKDKPRESLIEVATQAPDGTEEIHLILTVERRIADLAGLLPAFVEAIDQIYTFVGSEGRGPWTLVPALEAASAEALRQTSAALGAPLTPSADHEAAGRQRVVSRPQGRYSLLLPAGWTAARQMPGSTTADLLVTNGVAYAMVLYEDVDLPLADVRDGAVRNLERVARNVRAGADREIRVGDVPARQFHAEAVLNGTTLAYQYVILNRQGRVYQVIWWCRQEDYKSEVPGFEILLAGFALDS